MSNPIPVNIISDDDTTPIQFKFKSKKQRISSDSNPTTTTTTTTVFIIDDEPTPHKASPSPFTTSTPSVIPETPSVVPETPMPEFTKFSSSPNHKPSGLVCLESDEECEGFGSFSEKLNDHTSLTLQVENNLQVPSTCSKSSMLQDSSCISPMLDDELPQASQVSGDSGEEDDIQDSTSKRRGNNVNEKRSGGELAGKTHEGKDYLMNEKKQQREVCVTETPIVESQEAYVPFVRCMNSVSSSNLKPSVLQSEISR